MAGEAADLGGVMGMARADQQISMLMLIMRRQLFGIAAESARQWWLQTRGTTMRGLSINIALARLATVRIARSPRIIAV